MPLVSVGITSCDRTNDYTPAGISPAIVGTAYRQKQQFLGFVLSCSLHGTVLIEKCVMHLS